ncbi:MAG: type VI secretion system membrane subunit TssM, partial [Comamonadaceae bacterium]
MTSHSLVPMSARAAGLSYEDLCVEILKTASLDHAKPSVTTVQDKAAWSGFLQLLKRFRGRQPINGVIVTLSVQELLSSSEAERARLAKTIGTRLGELCDELAIKFPVYVLITKADLLAGFNEFFGQMTRDERSQVWGFTQKYKENAPSVDPTAQFTAEFDALVAQINRLLPQRLLAEQDLARRGLIYALPQQFVGLREVVNQTLQEAFSSSRFKEKPLFRGVYFTSGTQEGMPFDRVLSALKRRFSIASHVKAGAGQQGKSFFIETLFKGVMFNEAGLTGRNAKKERQLRLMQAGGLIALALALSGAALAWSVSNQNNLAYLEEVKASAATLRQAVEEAKTGDPENLVALLPLLDHAESLAASERYTGSPPVSWRWGLLQVPKVETAADTTYLRLLEDAWLPGIVRQLRRSLQQTSTNNPEASYEALKAYLMIHDADRFDARTVKAWIRHEWDASLTPQLVQAGVGDRLSHHLDRLMDDRIVLSPTPVDTALVNEVRQRLAQMSPAQRAYSRLKQLLTTGN